MKTENEKYQEWLAEQAPLKVGEMYKLLYAISRVSKACVWELKLKSMKGDNCVLTFDDGTKVQMHQSMLRFRIYEGLKQTV